MGDWIASISAQHRRWFSPSPRSLNFYSDALVIAHGPSVWWQRFKAGAGSGSDSLDTHATDEARLSANMQRVNEDTSRAMFERARMSIARDLADAHPKNVLIPLGDLAGIHAIGMHPHAKLVITRGDGSTLRLYCRAEGPAFKTRLDVLRSVLGDRFTTEKITG
jgi:hypothetical protein